MENRFVAFGFPPDADEKEVKVFLAFGFSRLKRFLKLGPDASAAVDTRPQVVFNGEPCLVDATLDGFYRVSRQTEDSWEDTEWIDASKAVRVTPRSLPNTKVRFSM